MTRLPLASRRLRRSLLATSAVAAALLATGQAASAKDVYLAAVRTCIDTAWKNAGACTVSANPQPTDPIPVWSFVAITKAEFDAGTPAPASLAQAVVPGPMLNADSADSAGLTVHVLNKLPVPVSLIIPGQSTTLTPVWVSSTGTVLNGTRGGDVKARVRSLNAETAPGGKGDYTWSKLKPGSFIYESATHQAIQVQMGLHGGLIVADGTTTPGAKSATAYGASYASQVTTYLSEIDGAMHRTVDTSPTHNATPAAAAGPVSPLEYWPDQFHTTQLVLNPDLTTNTAGNIAPNTTTLMRFFSAALRSHVQVVQDEYVSVVAEDGNPYRFPKTQYSVLLDAGKTKDGLLNPPAAEKVAIYDRMLNSGGLNSSKQGMIAYLNIGTSTTPTANNDSYTTPQGQKLTVAKPGVLANDVSPDKGTLTTKLGTTTGHGTLVLSADGSFTYTPTTTPSFVGTDSFTYQALEGTSTSNSATVTIAVTAALPVANADTYSATNTAPLSVPRPGVLANDASVPAGHALTAAIGTAPSHGTLSLNADGSFTYAAASGFVGADTFTYTANDGALKSSPAAVTVNVGASGPIAADDTYTAKVSSSGDKLTVLANDPGAGNYKSGSLKIVSKPSRGGKATVNAAGVITYAPPKLFVGTDVLTYQFTNAAGVASNVATVTINITY